MRQLSFLIFTITLLATGAFGLPLDFIQGGWDGGAGPLRIQFSGTDSDASGAIQLAELDFFVARFQLPEGEMTLWEKEDVAVDGFFFANVEDFALFASNGEYSISDTIFEGLALATVFDSRTFFPVATTDFGLASVPEPTYTALFGAISLGGLLLRRFRAQ